MNTWLEGAVSRASWERLAGPALLVGLAALGGLGGLAAGGCQPGPDVGGQSGDPSAYEHTSGVAVPDDGPGGSCAQHASTLVETATQGSSALGWPGSPVGPVLLEPATPDSPSKLVLADAAFGVRIVDTTQGFTDAGPSLLLEMTPLQLHVLDPARALVIGEQRIWLVALDGAVPERLDELELAGTPRLSTVVEEGADRVLHLLADEYDWSVGCNPRLRTTLHAVAVRGDRLELLAEQDLGDDVQAARIEHGQLVLVRGYDFVGLDVLRQSSVELAPLGMGEPTFGPAVPLQGVLLRAEDLELREDGLSLVALVSARDLREEQFELVQVDLGDPVAPVVSARCELPLRSTDAPQNIVYGGPVHDAVFVADGVLVRDRVDEPEVASTGRLVRPAADACTIDELELPGSAELVHAGGSRVLALGVAISATASALDTLELALFDASAPGTTPVATAALPVALAGLPDLDPSLLAQSVYLPSAVSYPGADGAQETDLVLVPFLMPSMIETSLPEGGSGLEDGPLLERLWAFSLSDHSLTARGTIEPGHAAKRVGDWLVTLAGDAMRLFELQLAPPFGSASVSSSRSLWPVAETGWLLPDALLARNPAPANVGQPLLRFELRSRAAVTDGERLSGLELSFDTEIARVGDWIVAIESSELCSEGAPSTLRVFDPSDPAAPTELGSRTSDELWNCWDERLTTETDWDLQPLGDDALIVRSLRYVEEGDDGGHNVFGFQILDLRDPSAPELAEVTMDDEHHGVGALLVGDQLYVSSLVPEGDAEGKRVRYFLHVLDLSDRAAPELGEPISIPGEVVAVDGDTLYTRDGVWEGAGGDVLQRYLHRVQLEPEGARILESYQAGGPVLSVRLLSSALLAAIGQEPRFGYAPAKPGQLLVLDPETLAVDGELALVPDSFIAGLSGDTLVTRTWWGVQLVDLGDLSAPELLQDLPRARFADLQGDDLLVIYGDGARENGAAVLMSLAR